MKSFFLTLLLVATGLGLFAQKQLDKAKDLLKNQKLAEAKTEIDNFLAVEKNQKSADAWYQKAKIYGAIAADENLKATVPDARVQSFDAIKKYVELEGEIKDASKRYLVMTLENNKPLVDLYTGYSKDAASFYNAGNFNDALTNFKNTLDIYAFMSEKGWTGNIRLDTTTTLYAGIAAEKASKLDEAAIYYGKIAEAKAKGEGFIEIYKWLSDHYRQKKDMAGANKYVALGKEVYPQDPFWSAFELEMVREQGTKDQLFAKYDEAIKSDPTNHLNYFNYGVELYQTAYDPDLTKRPANSQELITRATENIKKALEIKPDFPNANLVMGQIIYNEGVDIHNKFSEIRPPAGGKIKPEDQKKKDDLRAQRNKKYDEAIPYFQKVESTLGSQGKLKGEEKAFLKDAYDLLITIYEQQGNKEKASAYTDKFNAVERKHS